MAVQLTAEQQRRIEKIVHSGAYASVEEALNAAVGAAESVTRLECDPISMRPNFVHCLPKGRLLRF
jgi:hypothetical protein